MAFMTTEEKMRRMIMRAVAPAIVTKLPPFLMALFFQLLSRPRPHHGRGEVRRVGASYFSNSTSCPRL